MVLEIIFWVVLLLSLAGYWAPEPYVKYRDYIDLVLFVILGIKVFGAPH